MTSTVVEQSCKKASPSSCWLSSLPDEMVINCFTRVSRLDLMALSMVSKRCRSLVLSPHLYKTRSRIGFTEECVYVFIETPCESKQFILRRVKGKSSENRLIPIPSFPTPRFSSVVAFGEGVCVIGGLIESTKTSLVSFLDCRTHTWSYLPSMRIARARAQVGVLYGKIYVIGGIDIKNIIDYSNWAEVFDPKMQTWSGVNIQDPEIKDVVWDMTVSQNYVYQYEVEESIWNDFKKRSNSDIKRLLYCFHLYGEMRWCEPWSEVGIMNWRKVYGLEALQKSFRFSPRSVLSGGEMADVWQCYLLKHGHIDGLHPFRGYKLSISDDNIVMFWYKPPVEKDPKRIEIWCTEISMERRDGDEIWGTVQWSEHVYTVDSFPYSQMLLHSISVNV